MRLLRQFNAASSLWFTMDMIDAWAVSSTVGSSHLGTLLPPKSVSKCSPSIETLLPKPLGPGG